jgi:hypothetical protein
MHCTCLLLTQSEHPTGTAHRHRTQFPFGGAHYWPKVELDGSQPMGKADS